MSLLPGTQGWSEWSAAEEAGKVEPWKKWAPEAAPEAPMQSDWGAWSVDEPKSTEELWANWKPQAAPQAPQAVETWTQWGSACPQADACLGRVRTLGLEVGANFHPTATLEVPGT